MNKKFLKFMIILFMLSFSMVGAVSAKSLYVIANINDDPTPINAYDIQGDSLVYQATHNVPCHAWGAVGLAIDTDSEFLFVTYESSNIIEFVNATTMTSAGNTTAPGAGDLAGIVVDQKQQFVYTIDRSTNHLYVYEWDVSDTTLTLVPGPNYDYHELPNCYQAYGIALDETNNLLYVGDYTTEVKYYNTSDWSQAGSFIVSHNAQGIAIDVTNQLVYTGNVWGSYTLSKYNLNTEIETTIDIGASVAGIAVDPQTGLVYITTYCYGSVSQYLLVYDSDLKQLWSSGGSIGCPTGLCVPGRDIGYNPLNLSKVTQDTLVTPGSIIEYTITFDNELNNFAVDNVIITDNLPPDTLVDFHSTDGIYNTVTNTVTWDIGTLAAGAAPQSVWLKVTVKSSIVDTIEIYNYCTIVSDQTPQTTKYAITEVRPGVVPPSDESYFCPNPYNPDAYSSYPGTIYPNFDDPTSPITKLRIYDIAGELVKERDDVGSITPPILWDGKNEYGDYVANGVYFIIVENQADEKKIIKVAILR